MNRKQDSDHRERRLALSSLLCSVSASALLLSSSLLFAPLLLSLSRSSAPTFAHGCCCCCCVPASHCFSSPLLCSAPHCAISSASFSSSHSSLDCCSLLPQRQNDAARCVFRAGHAARAGVCACGERSAGHHRGRQRAASGATTAAAAQQRGGGQQAGQGLGCEAAAGDGSAGSLAQEGGAPGRGDRSQSDGGEGSGCSGRGGASPRPLTLRSAAPACCHRLCWLQSSTLLSSVSCAWRDCRRITPRSSDGSQRTGRSSSSSELRLTTR